MLEKVCELASNLVGFGSCCYRVDLYPTPERLPNTVVVFQKSVITTPQTGEKPTQEIINLGPFTHGSLFSLTMTNDLSKISSNPGSLLLIDMKELQKHTSEELASGAMQANFMAEIVRRNRGTVLLLGSSPSLGNNLEKTLTNQYAFVYHSKTFTDLLIATNESLCQGTQSCFYMEKENKVGFFLLNTEEVAYIIPIFPEGMGRKQRLLDRINRIIGAEFSESKKPIYLTGVFGDALQTMPGSVAQKWRCVSSDKQIRIYCYKSTEECEVKPNVSMGRLSLETSS